MLLSPIFVLQHVSLDKFKQEEDKAQKTNSHIDLKISLEGLRWAWGLYGGFFLWALSSLGLNNTMLLRIAGFHCHAVKPWSNQDRSINYVHNLRNERK